MPSLSNELFKLLLNKIKNSRFISISIDESSDFSKNDNHSLCVRHLEKGTINETFIKLFQLTDKSMQSIFQTLKYFLFAHNLKDKLLSIYTDRGGNMSGHRNGFQECFTHIYHHLEWTHCIAHRAALGTKDLVDIMPEIGRINICVYQLVIWIRDSNCTIKIFKEHEDNEDHLVLLKSIEIRWLSSYRLMVMLFIKLVKSNRNVKDSD